MPLERDVSARDRIQIGAAVRIEFVRIGRRSVRVRIDAPQDIVIHHDVATSVRYEAANKPRASDK